MKNKKDILLSAVLLLLAAVVIVSTLVYLLTDKMIPGLQPFAQAAMMLPMILLWKRTQKNQFECNRRHHADCFRMIMKRP